MRDVRCDRAGATRVGRASSADPLADVPLVVRRQWASLLLVVALVGARLEFGWRGLVVAGGVVLAWFLFVPRRWNLPLHALYRLRRPDGAPRRRAWRFRRAVASCAGVALPSRVLFASYGRNRQTGVEQFEVRLWPGDFPERWRTGRLEALRSEFRADHADVTETRPGRLRVRLVDRSVLPVVEPPHLRNFGVDVLTDPVPIGITDAGEVILVALWQGSVLVGGIPGCGKSGILQLCCGWVALDRRALLYTCDGKEGSELGRWSPVAAGSAGTVRETLELLTEVEEVRKRRADERAALGLRIWPPEALGAVVVVIDELAVLTDMTGLRGAEREEREALSRLLVHLVRVGRADRVIFVAATQRPSVDVINPGFRDLILTRVAGRCSTREQSATILGSGAGAGLDATSLPPSPGSFIVCGHAPEAVRGRAFWLIDDQLDQLLARAVEIRRAGGQPGTVVMAGPQGRPACREMRSTT